MVYGNLPHYGNPRGMTNLDGSYASELSILRVYFLLFIFFGSEKGSDNVFIKNEE